MTEPLRVLLPLSLLSAATLIMGAAITRSPARADMIWPPPEVVEAEDGSPRFGLAIALERRWLAIGDDRDEDGVRAAGRVSVLHRAIGDEAWRFRETLTAPQAPPFDRFGSALALCEDHLLVGSPGDGTVAPAAGRAHLFRLREGRWQHEAALIDPLGAAADGFGGSVALRGGVAVVGSPRADAAGLDSGRSIVFESRSGGWAATALLVPPGARSGDWFGHSVATDGERLAIGAYGDDERGNNAGAVHLFVRRNGGWEHERKVTAPDARSGDWFGFAVAIDGPWLLVAAPRSGTASPSAGAVWAFRRHGDAWLPHRRLEPTGPGTAHGWFGFTLALHRDTLLVGAPGRAGVDADGAPLTRAGRVAVFERSGGEWRPQTELAAPEPVAEDLFGSSLALDGSGAVVGPWRSEDLEPRPGRAWIFSRPPRRGTAPQRPR